MWDPEQPPGIEKEHEWKTDKIQMRPTVQLLKLYHC